MRMIKPLCFALVLILCALLAGCATVPPPPQHAMDACEVFREYPHWYWAAKDAEKKWGVPVSAQLAIILQESSFKGDAKPPRGKILWIIPWKRPTTADGYAQALNQTWADYQRATRHYEASRENFRDAVDFIGWYSDRANRKLHIPKYDAYRLYLAYHEGLNGFAQGSYKNKPWLVNVAHKVQVNHWHYDKQLQVCADTIKKSWWL